YVSPFAPSRASLPPSCISLLFSSSAPPANCTRSLHDALPISLPAQRHEFGPGHGADAERADALDLDLAFFKVRPEQRVDIDRGRSQEHTSELQSRENLVCRLLLEKKNHAKSYVVN